MRLAGIVRDSIVDGTGVRDVIFFQGCKHHCKGCHNPQSWNPNGGEWCTESQVIKRLGDSTNEVTISGGEPFDQIVELVGMVFALQYTGRRNTWIYTGYEFEQLMKDWKCTLDFLVLCGVKVIVDGKFEEDKKDPNLLFRGSSNQRLIDLKKSIKENKVVLWEEC